jgi:hypothetical protein
MVFWKNLENKNSFWSQLTFSFAIIQPVQDLHYRISFNCILRKMEGNQDYTSFFFLMLEFNLVAPYKGFCTISKSHKSDNKAIKNRP